MTYAFTAVMIFILTSGIYLTTSPFSLSFPHWKTGLAAVLLATAILLFYTDVYQEGMKKCSDITIDTISKCLEEKK